LKDPEHVIVFYRHGLLFAFNFNPTESYTNILVPVHNPGEYNVVLSSDDEQYGGNNLVAHMAYPTKVFDGQHFVELYLPARTAIVLKETVIWPEPEKKPAKKAAAKKTATAKKAAATANGLVGIFGYLSTAVSGFGIGWLADHYGWNYVFIGVIAMAIVGIMIFLSLWGVSRDGYEKANN
jgi:F0F1-type ATP synthase assembly protein I